MVAQTQQSSVYLSEYLSVCLSYCLLLLRSSDARCYIFLTQGNTLKEHKMSTLCLVKERNESNSACKFMRARAWVFGCVCVRSLANRTRKWTDQEIAHNAMAIDILSQLQRDKSLKYYDINYYYLRDWNV